MLIESCPVLVIAPLEIVPIFERFLDESRICVPDIATLPPTSKLKVPEPEFNSLKVLSLVVFVVNWYVLVSGKITS